MAGTVGSRFLEALVGRDVEGLEAVLHPLTDFKGLTPGRFWEAASAGEVVRILLGSWFEESDRIVEGELIGEGTIGDTQRFGYRLAVDNSEGRFLVEQQAYFREAEGRVQYLRMICSGFRASR